MLTRISDTPKRRRRTRKKIIKMAEDLMIKNLMEKMIETKPTKEHESK